MSLTKKTVLSRRGFLRALGLGGLSVLAPAAVQARAKGSEHELATLLDLSRCVGCGACVAACRQGNAPKFPEPVKPFPAMVPARSKPEDWSEKREVDDRLTPYNWLFIQTAEVDWKGERVTVHIPRRCLHCVNPPCANLCPWGAAGKQDNGIVRINDQVCLGGAKCRDVCPWKIPQRQTGVGLYLKLLPRFGGNGVMYKCDRCHELVAQGEQPRCVTACPFGVQSIGPRPEMIERARALARDMDGYIYGLEENGGTNTFYVSPVPFDLLDAALAQAQAKGPGRPHLGTVADSMADESNLAWATLLAPLAGVAAGTLGLIAGSNKDKEDGHGE
ncbi:MAG TPA: 4Fe-4S ferredoxin [Desulfovibrio sp.]|nr:4Fe-4S ferredoxin [Desulfovibrio sp.]